MLALDLMLQSNISISLCLQLAQRSIDSICLMAACHILKAVAVRNVLKEVGLLPIQLPRNKWPRDDGVNCPQRSFFR